MEALDDAGDSPLMPWASMGSPLARENSRFMMHGAPQSSLQSFTSSAAAGMRGGPPHPTTPLPIIFSFRVPPRDGISQYSSSEATSISGGTVDRRHRRPTFTMPSVFPFRGGLQTPNRPVGPQGTELSLRDQYSLANQTAAHMAGALATAICVVQSPPCKWVMALGKTGSMGTGCAD